MQGERDPRKIALSIIREIAQRRPELLDWYLTTHAGGACADYWYTTGGGYMADETFHHLEKHEMVVYRIPDNPGVYKFDVRKLWAEVVHGEQLSLF